MNPDVLSPGKPSILSEAIKTKLKSFIQLIKKKLTHISEFTLLSDDHTELSSAKKLVELLKEKGEMGSTIGHDATIDQECFSLYLGLLETLVTSRAIDNTALLAMLQEKDHDGSSIANDPVHLQTYFRWLATLVANRRLSNATLLKLLTEKPGWYEPLSHSAAKESDCFSLYLGLLETLVTSDTLDNVALLKFINPEDGWGNALCHSTAHNSKSLSVYLDFLTTLESNSVLDNATLLELLTEKDEQGNALCHSAAQDSESLSVYLKWLETLVVRGILDKAMLLEMFTEKNDDVSKRLPVFSLLRALIMTSTDSKSTCTALRLTSERLVRTDAHNTAAIQHLAHFLQSEHCPDDFTLDLRNCDLNTVEIQHLANALPSGHCPNHLTLNLRKNELDYGAALPYLITALESPQCPPFLNLCMTKIPEAFKKQQQQISKLLLKRQLQTTQEVCLMFLRGLADSQNPLAQFSKSKDIIKAIFLNLFLTLPNSKNAKAEDWANTAMKPFDSMIRIQRSRSCAKTVEEWKKGTYAKDVEKWKEDTLEMGYLLTTAGLYSEKGKVPQVQQALPAIISSRLKSSDGPLVDDVTFSSRGMNIHFHSELGAVQFSQEFPEYYEQGVLTEAKCITLPTPELINPFLKHECKVEPKDVYNSENIASSAKAPGI